MRLGTVHNYTISYALIDHCFAWGKSKSLALADDAKTQHQQMTSKCWPHNLACTCTVHVLTTESDAKAPTLAAPAYNVYDNSRTNEWPCIHMQLYIILQ